MIHEHELTYEVEKDSLEETTLDQHKVRGVFEQTQFLTLTSDYHINLQSQCKIHENMRRLHVHGLTAA